MSDDTLTPEQIAFFAERGREFRVRSRDNLSCWYVVLDANNDSVALCQDKGDAEVIADSLTQAAQRYNESYTNGIGLRDGKHVKFRMPDYTEDDYGPEISNDDR